MDGVSVGKGANYVEVFAQRLKDIAEEKPEFIRRRNIADDMFYGNCDLLEEGFTFEEMIDIFDEHLGERCDCGVVYGIGETLTGMRSRKRFQIW